MIRPLRTDGTFIPIDETYSPENLNEQGDSPEMAWVLSLAVKRKKHLDRPEA